MKHSISFMVKETGETILISSKIFADGNELTVAKVDDSPKGYKEIEIDIIQQEENERR